MCSFIELDFWRVLTVYKGFVLVGGEGGEMD